MSKRYCVATMVCSIGLILSGPLWHSCGGAYPGRPARIRPLRTLPEIADAVAASAGMAAPAVVAKILRDVDSISESREFDPVSGLYILSEGDAIYLFGLPEPGLTSGMRGTDRPPCVVACTTSSDDGPGGTIYYMAIDQGIGCITRYCRVPPVPGCEFLVRDDQEYIVFTATAVSRFRAYYPGHASSITGAGAEVPCNRPEGRE